MNSAIGLNLPIATPITAPADAGQIIPLEGGGLPHACVDGNCVEQSDTGFFEVLNAELAALTEEKPLDFLALAGISELESIKDLANMDDVEDVSELSIPLALLPDYLKQLEETPSDHFNLIEMSENIDIDTLPPELKALFEEALAQLPENITALPLTDENQQFIQQQAFALMMQNHPETSAQLKQISESDLPLEAKPIMSILGEVALKGQAKAPLQTHVTLVPITDEKQKLSLKPEESALSLVDADVDADSELTFKDLLGQNALEEDGSKEKHTVENLVAKTTAQSDATPQKFSVEAISTAVNNVMGLNNSSINTPTAAAVQSGTTLLLPQNPSPEQWGGALGDKVQWMINSKLESAELRIDPPHLGKMEVSIKMTDEGASVVIQTQHAATRDLVEAASHRLKEMLENSGYNQVDVDVSHKEQNQAENQFSDNENQQDSALRTSESLAGQDDISASDVIAGSSNYERPGLDLFV